MIIKRNEDGQTRHDNWQRGSASSSITNARLQQQIYNLWDNLNWGFGRTKKVVWNEEFNLSTMRNRDGESLASKLLMQQNWRRWQCHPMLNQDLFLFHRFWWKSILFIPDNHHYRVRRKRNHLLQRWGRLKGQFINGGHSRNFIEIKVRQIPRWTLLVKEHWWANHS